FSGCLSNPKTSLASFDFVITNLGDCLSDDRVIPCSGALSSITTQKLCKASKDFIKTFSFLPHPRVAFFVGQASTEAKPSHGFIEKAAKDLKKLIDCTGGSLLILLPQNTKPSLVLEFETLLEGTPRFFWKHSSEDTPPYEAFLGTADYLIITGDSFPLLADALATEAPLYVYPPFSASPEYPLFCEHFFEKGLARPFEGTLDFWARPAFSETESVAHTLLKRFLKPS
ncbi:MAG: ELM1/GtrOC1 family putative glycosyltransferase, partial [Holosporales bacterium]